MSGRADSVLSGVWRIVSPATALLPSLAIVASIGFGEAHGTDVDIVYGLELSTTEFDEEFFAGSVAGFGAYIGAYIGQHYQIGLRFHDSLFFTPSLDRGKELSGDDDLLDISARVLYLQREWPLADGFRLHAMIGISRVEIEDEEFVCTIFLPCLPFAETKTTYRNHESGFAYGFGGSWAIGDTTDLSLRYIDYSDSEFDYRSVHLGVDVRLAL